MMIFDDDDDEYILLQLDIKLKISNVNDYSAKVCCIKYASIIMLWLKILAHLASLLPFFLLHCSSNKCNLSKQK